MNTDIEGLLSRSSQPRVLAPSVRASDNPSHESRHFASRSRARILFVYQQTEPTRTLLPAVNFYQRRFLFVSGSRGGTHTLTTAESYP